MSNIEDRAESSNQDEARPEAVKTEENADGLKKPKRGYFAKHWRGELSLVESFWVNVVVVGILSYPVLAFLLVAAAKEPSTRHLPLILFYLLVLWQTVGLRKRAKKHIAENGMRSWGGAAMIPVLIGLMILAYPVIMIGGAILWAIWMLLTGL